MIALLEENGLPPIATRNGRRITSNKRELKRQWDALNNNKDLTVHVSWDNKSSTSVTGGYVWNAKGDLTSVNVTLSKNTGNTDEHMSDSSGYIHGSTLNNNAAMRQAYVVAHEFAHVEYAETRSGGESLRRDGQMSKNLQELEREVGPKHYAAQPGVGEMQQHLDQHKYTREKRADQRAWDVLGDPK